MKVKVYNVNKRMRSLLKSENLEVFGTRQELAVLEGPMGFVVTCSEGVHFQFTSPDDTVPLGLTRPCKKGQFAIMPSHTTDIPVSEILECEHREQPLGSFVRRFGTRLESNYATLLQSIKKVGLDPTDYPR